MVAILRVALFFGLLVNPFPSFGTDQVITLSDSEPAYKALAALQRYVCNAKPTHRCDVSGVECATNLDARVRAEWPEFTEDKDGKHAQSINEVCRIRGTPYEIPGIHWLLRKRFESIKIHAKSLGLEIPNNIIFGGLPSGGIGVEVLANTKTGHSIILVDLRFMQFITEFSKLVSQTLPYQILSPTTQVFDVREEMSRDKIVKNSEFTEQLIFLLNRFRGGEALRATEFKPDQVGGAFARGYAEIVEEFAMTHEIGHVFLDHGSSSLNWKALGGAVAKLFQRKKGKTALTVAELEADIFAARIIIEATKQRMKDDTSDVLACGLYAVEFYFITRQILADAGINAVDSTSDGPVDTGTYQDVVKVANCAVLVGCLVRDIKGLSSALRRGEQHPSNKFRGAVMRKLIADSLPANRSDWIQVCEATNRNAVLLWELSGDEYFARKPWID